MGLGLGLDPLDLPPELGELGSKGFDHDTDPGRLAHDLLDVLRGRQPLDLRALPSGRPGTLALVEGRHARLGATHALLGRLHLALEASDLGAEIADRALAGEQRGIAAAGGPAPAESARRAEHLAADGDEARPVAVLGVEALGGAEVPNDDHRAQQVGQQAGVPRADERVPEPHHARILPDVRVAAAVEPVERQERGLAAPRPSQVAERRLGCLERLHHHPLEPLAERRLDGALELAGDLQQVGDRSHDSPEAGLAGRREHGLDALGVAGSLGLQLLERRQARPPTRQGSGGRPRPPPPPRPARRSPPRCPWPGLGARAPAQQRAPPLRRLERRPPRAPLPGWPAHPRLPFAPPGADPAGARAARGARPARPAPAPARSAARRSPPAPRAAPRPPHGRPAGGAGAPRAPPPRRRPAPGARRSRDESPRAACPWRAAPRRASSAGARAPPPPHRAGRPRRRGPAPPGAAARRGPRNPRARASPAEARAGLHPPPARPPSRRRGPARAPRPGPRCESGPSRRAHARPPPRHRVAAPRRRARRAPRPGAGPRAPGARPGGPCAAAPSSPGAPERSAAA